MPRKRWAVFISGRGSNLAALIDMYRQNEMDLRLVVSDSCHAYGLKRASWAGIPTMNFPRDSSNSRALDWASMADELHRRGLSHLFLAGFMRVLPSDFIDRWQGKILNLHPSILPSYPGLKSIERAYADGSSMGSTVHEVIREVDAGPRVLQRETLNSKWVRSYSLANAELMVHMDEQRLIKESIRRWKMWPTSL